MIDSLHQVNVSYSNKEDRLLLKITTQKGDEYRIWLTRRFSALLSGILSKEMERHGGAVSVGARKETKQLFHAGAFEKQFDDEKSTQYPLGKNGFLAYGVKTANTKEGNLHLEILPEQGPGVSFNLNQSLVYMFHNLLLQGIDKAEWNVADARAEPSRQVH